jgi:sugar (pentulose or hexulose) kinase
MGFLLGIDAGTSVVKAAIFDPYGNEIGVAARPTTLKTPRPGWVEVSLTEIWEKTVAAIREVFDKHQIDPKAIAGIGVTGQMVGVWLIDKRGLPVRDAILHIDQRAQQWIEECQKEDTEFLSNIFDYSGSAMQPGCTLPLIAWLDKHEPEILARTANVLCCKDWLIYQLTGTIQIDPSEASVMPGDTRARGYAEPLFNYMKINQHRALFPKLIDSEQIVGAIHRNAEERTGLYSGTPVVAGTGDVLASSIGAGAVEPGTAYTILGTALINGVITEKPIEKPYGIGFTFCQPTGFWVRVMVNVLGTPNLDWCVNQFFTDLKELSPGDRFEELERYAHHSGAGAQGVIYLPYLSPTGMFAPFVEPSARANFFGLSLDHSRGDMLRAVYDGIALSIRHCYESMPVDVQEIRLTGGGARSSFWSQIIADCTGKRCIVPKGSELGAKGAALLAGVGIGWYESINAASKMVEILRIHEPQQTTVYDDAFITYTEMVQTLRPVWQQHSLR